MLHLEGINKGLCAQEARRKEQRPYKRMIQTLLTPAASSPCFLKPSAQVGCERWEI